MARTGTGPGASLNLGIGGAGPSSITGLTNQSMPAPAARPRGPKLKFTTEDDQLLVDLKENKALTWKQIAEFFPGRSSGTLQVRYCTKLKAKTTQWTDDTVSFSILFFFAFPEHFLKNNTLNYWFQVMRLRNAMEEYEQDRWKIVAGKVGGGFTAAACREKAKELQ